MRTRFIFSLFSMVLAAALVVGGFSLAWFTDEHTPSSGPALSTGTVDYEIIAAELVGCEEDEDRIWRPGESRDFFWAIENTGSKAALYRAKLKETVETGTFEGQETAWGKGMRFVNPGNWAMYFIFDEDPTVVPFIAGQHHYAGTVSVYTENSRTKVTIQMAPGCVMREAHVHVAGTPSEFPMAGQSGNPKVGHFRYKKENLNNATQLTFDVTDSIPPSGPVYVAAHAEVIGGSESVPVEGSYVEWVLTDGASANWIYQTDEDSNDGWWYYCGPPVRAGETVKLELTGTLSETAPSGEYKVVLEAEAVQASNDAINHVWWSDYPGGNAND